MAELAWRCLSETQRRSLRTGGTVPYAKIPPRCWQWVRQISESLSVLMLWGLVEHAHRTTVDENTTLRLMSVGEGQRLLYCVVLEPSSGGKAVLVNTLPRATIAESRAARRLMRRIGFNASLSRMNLSQPSFWRLSEFHPRMRVSQESQERKVRLVYTPEKAPLLNERR